MLSSNQTQICFLASAVKPISPKGSKPRKEKRKAQLKFEKIEVRGRDSASTKKSIKKKATALKYCYARELQKNQALSGSLSIQTKIPPNGKVKSTVIIESQINSPIVESCVIRTMRRLRFQKLDTESTVNISLIFQSVKK